MNKYDHTQVDAWGMDGDSIQITLPSEHEVSKMVAASEKKYNARLGNASLQVGNPVMYLCL